MLATVEEFTAEMDERMRSIGFSWARHRFPDEAPPPVSEYQLSVAEASVDELLDLLEDHIPVEQPHLISVDGEVLPSTDQGYAQWRRGWRKAFQDLTINPHDTMGRYQPALDEALRVFASDKAKLSEIIRDVDWANGLVTQENPTLDLKL